MLKEAGTNGAVVVVCSQCPQATVNMNAYEAGLVLRQAGALSGCDMTSEAAVTQLYYLVSTCRNAEEVKMYMERDLRGELREEMI